MSASNKNEAPTAYCAAPKCCVRFKAGKGHILSILCDGGEKKKVWICSDPCLKIVKLQQQG